MAKEFFKNLPDTSTPLNANRLNGLLNGNEAMGNIVVGDVKGKNLFNMYNSGLSPISVSKSIVNNSLRITSGINGSNASQFYVIPFGREELLGKEITLSASWVSSANKTGRIYIGACDEDFTNRHSYEFLTTSGGSVTVTLPSSFTDNNTRFILAFYVCYNENITTGDYMDYKNVQIEEGTATEYTPYKAFGIVESGSNSNGSWVKWEDGTMIQYGKVTRNIDFTSQSGITDWYYIDGHPINFPQNFIDTDYDIDVRARSGGITTLFVYSVRPKTTSQAEFSLTCNVKRSVGDYTFGWKAIGRWK